SDNFYSRYRITLEHIRGYVQLKTSEYIKGKDERAIIQALTVGVKEELSEELKQNYINAGVVHVLAISGLHVGIIYMVLSHLLFFFDRNVYLRILRLFLIICAIWFYAVISGMSPSIVRACTMFTLLGIAKSTNRNISIFNVVAASALFMLIANPLLIFDLGFQLSYLAVTGIIYFQPLFYNWIHFNNRVLDYFYKLFTVSLAAQVSTSPLSVFYFHQFPVYFWLSNIFIIILIIIILSGSFLFILASAWGAVADIIGKVLELITHLANRFIDLINSLPYSVIAGISLTKLQVILFFCIIVAITIWLKMKISRFFVYTATLLLFFIITSFYNYYKHTANLLVIYNLPKQSVIGLYGSNYNYLLHNNSVDKRNKTTLRPFETHLIQRKAEENLKIYSIDSLQFLTNKKADKLVCSLNTKVQLYKGTSIVLLKKQAESELAKTEINNSDFIFVLGGVFPKEIQNFRGKIILSSELSAYEHNAWIKKLTAGKIPFHDIRNEGAFMLNY
ncbi:MAG: ComEC/Rec2 family competence protein, partial [Bacteroidales bacterium]|nr:ComEC/Rec2 family competence protein [Bacteroidales bacterium]